MIYEGLFALVAMEVPTFVIAFVTHAISSRLVIDPVPLTSILR